MGSLLVFATAGEPVFGRGGGRPRGRRKAGNLHAHVLHPRAQAALKRRFWAVGLSDPGGESIGVARGPDLR